ncbi:MAG: hypothetical protein J6Q54_01315 [Oscillospiraceae bacterium]|nr:hypothetical protein [Oscillospiraceae bacterium]
MATPKKKKTFKESDFYLGWKKLLEDIKPMTFSEKVDHIWTYYKEYIGVVALLLFVLIGLVSSMVNNLMTDTVLAGAMINVTCSQEAYDYISTDYEEVLGLTGHREVRLEYTYFQDMEANTNEEDYYAAMGIIAEVAAKKLDYLVMDKVSMGYYAGQEVYMDLSRVFTEEELADFAERGLLIYCMEEEEKIPWPAAIKINDLPYIQDNLTVQNEVYLAFAGSSDKVEELRAFWEYLLAWEK